MAPTQSWTCPRCRAVNAAGTDVCGACALAALAGARRLHQADAVAAISPSPKATEGRGWISKESALLLPETLLAGGLMLACPLWFVVLLRHGQYLAAAVLFVGMAPAMLLAAVAFRQKSAGGLYLTSWVTFVAIVIAALVARVTQ